METGWCAGACFNELQKAHREAAPSRATVFRWYTAFKVDFPEEGARGQPRSARTPEASRYAPELLAEDFTISLLDLADCLDLGKSTAHDILTENLQVRHVSSMWVPHILTDENQHSRVSCAKHIRPLSFKEGMESFCSKVAVQDETWIYLSGQLSKQENK